MNESFHQNFDTRSRTFLGTNLPTMAYMGTPSNSRTYNIHNSNLGDDVNYSNNSRPVNTYRGDGFNAQNGTLYNTMSPVSPTPYESATLARRLVSPVGSNYSSQYEGHFNYTCGHYRGANSRSVSVASPLADCQGSQDLHVDNQFLMIENNQLREQVAQLLKDKDELATDISLLRVGSLFTSPTNLYTAL
ncbi:hypothetical protein Ciccas_001817 [Cichlidogyrus casuarinus]|uniref:Uncharacterized protein n=1 Tax=Cichlidogyrus casuarinus TaxID=1844966 RepID=A0ABD2QJ95_9PLAT